MSHDDVLHRFRLRLFALAGELGNVRAACRQMGVHHSTYYRWRNAMRWDLEACGPESGGSRGWAFWAINGDVETRPNSYPNSDRGSHETSRCRLPARGSDALARRAGKPGSFRTTANPSCSATSRSSSGFS